MEIPNEEMMLIRYACVDMGLKCPFVVKGETLEEVVKKALEHVKENHTADFNGINSPAEIERMGGGARPIYAGGDRVTKKFKTANYCELAVLIQTTDIDGCFSRWSQTARIGSRFVKFHYNNIAGL